MTDWLQWSRSFNTSATLGDEAETTSYRSVISYIAKITGGIKYNSLSPASQRRDRRFIMSAKERLKVKVTKDSVTLLPCFYFVEVGEFYHSATAPMRIEPLALE